MTTAEALRAKGFAEGVAEVLVHMLTMNVRPVPEDVAGAVHKIVRQAVRDMSVDELKVWMARTAVAETPEEMDEIFGWPSAACPERRSGAGESPVGDREEASFEG